MTALWLLCAAGAVTAAVLYRREARTAPSVWDAEAHRALSWLWVATTVLFVVDAVVAAR